MASDERIAEIRELRRKGVYTDVECVDELLDRIDELEQQVDPYFGELQAEVERLRGLLDGLRTEVRMYCRPGMVNYDVFPVFKEVDAMFQAAQETPHD